MIRKDFPKLGEHYFEERLPNGLLVRVMEKPGFAKRYAFVAADYGSIDAEFFLNGKKYTTPQGVAHYLEHKMFDLPEGNAMQEFAKYAGANNAFTSYTMTAYYVECTEHLEENFEILLRMVTTAYFTDESVQKERGIIAQEINDFGKLFRIATLDNLNGVLCGGAAVIHAAPCTLTNADVDHVARGHRQHISRGNVMDMAIGVIIATAFGKITTSLVNDVFMPLIGYIIGGVDLSTLNITLSPAVLDEAGEVVKEAVVIGIGTFLTTVIDFILVAFVVFLVVKAFNAAKQKLEKPAEPEPEEPEPTKEELLLTEIRDLLKTKG